MSKQATRSFFYFFTSSVLALGTTVLFYLAAAHLASAPRAVTGPIEPGYNFTMVAMKGTSPVELVHEWSGKVPEELRGGAAHRKSLSAAQREFLMWPVKHPIVWAAEGRATGSFRYYLTADDLQKVNSQLDSKPGEHPHNVEVKVMKDDPRSKCQTLQLTVHGDDTDFINVYQVKGDRAEPLKWIRFRPLSLLPVEIMLPVVLIASGYMWKWLLRKAFSSRQTI